MPEKSPLVPRRSYPVRPRSSSSLKDILLGEGGVPRVSGEMRPHSLGKDTRNRKRGKRAINPFEAGKRRLTSLLAGRRGGLVDKGVEQFEKVSGGSLKNPTYKDTPLAGVEFEGVYGGVYTFEDDPPGKPGGLTAEQKGSMWKRENALSPDGIDQITWAKLVDKTMPEKYWAKKKKADEKYQKSPEGKKHTERMKRESTPEELAKRAKRFTGHAKKLEESGVSPFADTRLMLQAAEGKSDGLLAGWIGKHTPPHTRGAYRQKSHAGSRAGKPHPEQLEESRDSGGRETLYRSEKAASLKKMWEGHEFPAVAVPARPGHESYYDKGELKYRKVKKGKNFLPIGGWRPKYKSPYSKPRSK